MHNMNEETRLLARARFGGDPEEREAREREEGVWVRAGGVDVFISPEMIAEFDRRMPRATS